MAETQNKIRYVIEEFAGVTVDITAEPPYDLTRSPTSA